MGSPREETRFVKPVMSEIKMTVMSNQVLAVEVGSLKSRETWKSLACGYNLSHITHNQYVVQKGSVKFLENIKRNN